jgi:putative nucleotidyltransferase with HDIG domain
VNEWLHLVRRFFDVARARRLSPAEQRIVSAWLCNTAESAAFWDQSVPDQRHAFRAARFVAEERPHDREVIRAALLHDVGKRHAHLGIVGRSVAGACRSLGIPTWGRVRAYLEHGELGARELEGAGSSDLVVNFARHHHATAPPASIPSDTWELLLAADDETT